MKKYLYLDRLIDAEEAQRLFRQIQDQWEEAFAQYDHKKIEELRVPHREILGVRAKFANDAECDAKGWTRPNILRYFELLNAYRENALLPDELQTDEADNALSDFQKEHPKFYEVLCLSNEELRERLARDE